MVSYESPLVGTHSQWCLSRRAAGSGCVILVFGGNGQLGQELVRVASVRGIALVAMPRAEIDIADSTAVSRALAKYNPTLVVNAAAYTKVDLAEIEVEQARRGNEIGPAVLADSCLAAELPLVHIST